MRFVCACMPHKACRREGVKAPAGETKKTRRSACRRVPEQEWESSYAIRDSFNCNLGRTHNPKKRQGLSLCDTPGPETTSPREATVGPPRLCSARVPCLHVC